METWSQDVSMLGEMYTAEEILPYLSEEEKNDAKEEALAQLNDELARSENVELLVPRLLRSCELEAKELRQSMNTMASMQIADTHRASAIVRNNISRVKSLQRLFIKKNALMHDVMEDSPGYAQLCQLNVLRDNVQAVIDWSSALKEVRYGNLYQHAREHHFVTVYNRLKRLQRIRDTVITKAGSNYITYETFFEPYFTKLDAVLAVFTGEVLSVLSNDFVALAIEKALAEVTDNEEKNPTPVCMNDGATTTADSDAAGGAAVNLQSASTQPGKENPSFALLRECASVCSEEMKRPVLSSRLPGKENEQGGTLVLTPTTVTSAISTGVARAWRDQIMSDSYTFPSSIQQQQSPQQHPSFLLSTSSSLLMPVSLPNAQGEYDVMSELTHMRRVEALLEALEYSLMPWTTPAFSFFVVALQATHEQVLRVLRSYLIPQNAAHIPARELMATSVFVQWYKKMLSRYGYARHVDMTGLDEHAAACVTTAVSGLSDHLVQLCRACAITALAPAVDAQAERTPLFASPGGWPYTTGPSDVLTVLQQSLEGISCAMIEPVVLRQVEVACVNALLAYMDECQHRMDFDVWEEALSKVSSTEAPPATTSKGNTTATTTNNNSSNHTNTTNNTNHSGNNNNTNSGEEYEAMWQQRRALFLYAMCNDCIVLEDNVEAIKLPFLVCRDDSSASVRQRSRAHIDATPSAAPADTVAATAENAEVSVETATLPSSASPFTQVDEAIIDRAYFYLDEIVLHVERVVGGQWARVFRAPAWYDISGNDNDNPTRLIIDTEIEYVQEEFTSMLQKPSWRSKITRQMMVRFVEAYIAGMLEFLGDIIRNPRKHTVLGGSWNGFIDALARDTALFVRAWQLVLTAHTSTSPSSSHKLRPSPLLDRARAALGVLQSLLTVRKPADLDTLLQHELLTDFGDCASFVVRFTLLARVSELGKEMCERMLAMWQERIAYQHRDANDRPTAGWSSPPSLLGTVDRTIAELEQKPVRFFGKSARKRREEQRLRKATEDKEVRRLARQARHEADVAAAARKRLPVLSAMREGREQEEGRTTPSAKTAGTQRRMSDGRVIEVATLADVLR